MRSSVIRLAIASSVLTGGCSRTPPSSAPPLPQVSGSLTLDGISRPVRIVRDRWGVPHVYAQSPGDLFFAQGFVQAQDRLFQMDLWRRSAQGRLSEVLGPNFVERDAMTRRMQYRADDLTEEWASYGPEVKPITEAFVRGINAWVAIARERVPEEFTLAGWLPEPWKADDLLNRTDAFVASGDAEAEIFRARLVAAVGERRANALLPSATRYRIPSGLDVKTINYVVGDALRRVGTPPFFSGLAAPIKKGDGDIFDGKLPENGTSFVPTKNIPVPFSSNAWAIEGSRSATGKPILANDPHRPFAHPSLRYLVHLSAPGWNVIGATSPWLPGVVVGHNDRVAWGTTALPADTEDVYVERINPSHSHQVESRGRWINTVVVKDPIIVKGQNKPFEFEREFTPHGIVIASDRDHHLAFTVRWSGSEPGGAGELAALALDRAGSSTELREALGRWKMPAIDVAYADVDGTVGRQAAGVVPVRTSWDGALPAPGWTGAFEWKGWQKWRSSDTSDGFVISANQNAARLGRLEEMFASQRVYTLDDFKRLQHDTTSWIAERLVPLLMRVRPDGEGRDEVERARQQLLRWDKRLAVDSTAATLYVLWERALLRKLAAGRVTPVLLDEFVQRAAPMGILAPALLEPSQVWFDGDPIDSRDRLLVSALTSAAGEMRAAFGQDERAALWGRLHALMFKHPLAVTQAARRRFNVGSFEQSGYADTLQSTYGGRFEVDGGASFREIVDLADWDRSVATNAPGQSGSPGSAHFRDLAKLWAAGEYFPLAFSDDAVQANTESILTLVPR